MVLGTLLKGCVRAGIWPIPQYPYNGFTIKRVLRDIEELRIRSLCEIKEGIQSRASLKRIFESTPQQSQEEP
jgi:hypothetical protein